MSLHHRSDHLTPFTKVTESRGLILRYSDSEVVPTLTGREYAGLPGSAVAEAPQNSPDHTFLGFCAVLEAQILTVRAPPHGKAQV